MRLRSLFRLPVVVTAALLLVAFAAVASAKRASTRARSFSATTRDLNANGRIDAIDVRGGALPGSAGGFRVAGHRVLAVRRIRGGARLIVSPGSKPDTAARPFVSIGSTRIRPTDGARPVLTSPAVPVRGRGGALSAINLAFSEPVIAKRGAVRVRGYLVVAMRRGTNGKLTVVVRAAGQDSRAGSPAVTLVGSDLRDASGNPGPSGQVKLSTAGSPGKTAGGAPSGGGTAATTSKSSPTGGAPGSGSSSGTPWTGGPGAGSTGSEGGSTDPGGSTGNSGSSGNGGSTDGGGSTGSDGGSTDGGSSGDGGATGVTPPPVDQPPLSFAGTVANPFVQSQMMPFGRRSFYLQPWRSYQDTFPATRMLDAAGVNFNIYNGNTSQISAGAKLLHDAGFTHARIEIPWNTMDYNNPGALTTSELKEITPVLQQLQANGIRPLILLNSNDGIPCPVQNVTLNVTAPAAAGATQVQLDSTSAALVKPGYTGFKQYGRDAGVIITAVDSSGSATLSQPLKTAIAAGPQTAVTLKFQPFFPVYNMDGSDNANTDQTMDGWLQYVAGVTQTAKSILGDDKFDVEVWNELSFGSAFLSAGNYYKPAPQGFGPLNRGLLLATVNYIRDPSNGLADVGIGDGFTNQSPFTGGSGEVPGVTAIDKHPYASAIQFPSQATFNSDRPLDALGNPEGTQVDGQWHDDFIPTFTALLPEYFLTAIQTETVTRDLAPFNSNFGGSLHGRDAAPAGGAAPAVWITEVNLDASTVHNTLTSPDGTATSPMSTADQRHFQAKAILRYLSAWVGKGTSVIDFFALANAGGLNIADPSFFNTAASTHSYPGLAAAGETMVDVQRFLSTMAGAQNISSTSPLSLTSVSSYDNADQFAGNGTANYPPLYNRNMVGFFPFQVTAHKWVIPTYVMTLNLATLYNPNAPATDVTRQDMPPETFSLTVNGVNGATATAAAVDPLSNSSVPATITARTSSSITVEVPLTDSPRMLTLQDS